jgi:hypothetical protein
VDVTVWLFVGEDTDYTARRLRETITPDIGSVDIFGTPPDDWIDEERLRY